MDWPHLYQVTLRDVDDDRRNTYVALSWFGGHKAVAMAMEQHCQRAPGWIVYDVDVWDMGPAPRTDDGTVGSGPPGYLEDRMEF